MVPDIANHIHCAEAFLEAHRRCDPEEELEDQSKIALPAIVCGAFASEVALKALLQLHGQTARGHDLQDLFQRLPAHIRLQIREGACLSTEKFDRYLRNARHAFSQWRYFYESEEDLITNVAFLGTLASVVLAIVERMENAA
jgi:hypothetical protein